MVIKLSKNRIDLDGLPLMNADLQGCTVNGSALSSASGSAFDQVALANLTQLLASGSSGARVGGYQWKLATDEWGASSTNETFGSLPNQLVPYDMGTVFGGNYYNSTYPPALAFDNSYVDSSHTNIGATNANPMWVGKDWGSGVSRKIDKFVLDSQANANWSGNNGSTITVALYGANSLPASATDGTLLHTATGIENAPGSHKTYTVDTGITQTTAYRYHWISLTSSQGEKAVGEVTFYEAGQITPGYYVGNAMTLVPGSSVSVSSAPSYIDAYFLYKDDSASAVLGTDITVELSRDGGTTWTTATLSNLAAYDGTYSFIKARGDVSAQPSGTSMLVRINTLNAKSQRVAAPAVYAE